MRLWAAVCGGFNRRRSAEKSPAGCEKGGNWAGVEGLTRK